MANYMGVVKWFDNDRGYGFISKCHLQNQH